MAINWRKYFRTSTPDRTFMAVEIRTTHVVTVDDMVNALLLAHEGTILRAEEEVTRRDELVSRLPTLGAGTIEATVRECVKHYGDEGYPLAGDNLSSRTYEVAYKWARAQVHAAWPEHFSSDS